MVDCFDHDRISKDDPLGSFIILPEWYLRDNPDRPASPPLGRCEIGYRKVDDWWPLHPVGKHAAAGEVEMSVRNKAHIGGFTPRARRKKAGGASGVRSRCKQTCGVGLWRA